LQTHCCSETTRTGLFRQKLDQSSILVGLVKEKLRNNKLFNIFHMKMKKRKERKENDMVYLSFFEVICFISATHLPSSLPSTQWEKYKW
jgi:hypothetical protein